MSANQSQSHPSEKSRIRGIHLFIGYALTIFGFGLTYYIYKAPLKEVDPTFILERNTQLIVSKDLISAAPLKIVKPNGEEVKSNVYSQTFYFFNQGKETISKEKILEPLFLSINDSTSKILDFRILKESRSVIDSRLLLDSVSKSKVWIDFRLLEEDDGIAGQILYASDNSSFLPLQINGTIAGYPKPFSTYYKSKTGFPEIVVIMFWVLISSSPILFITYLLTRPKIVDDQIEESLSEWQKTLPKPQKKEKKTVSNWLTSRYQLVIRNENNFAEKTSIGFTYNKVILFSVMLFSLIFIISLFMSKTVLAKWFDPGFKAPYEESVTIPESLKL